MQASSASDAQSTTATTSSTSDMAVRDIMRQGLQHMLLKASAGFLLGGMAGIVVARGGGSSSARKALAGLGMGVGLGSAWTRTSINLEEMLGSISEK
jgi:outer membrane lipoprotein SlyB